MAGGRLRDGDVFSKFLRKFLMQTDNESLASSRRSVSQGAALKTAREKIKRVLFHFFSRCFLRCDLTNWTPGRVLKVLNEGHLRFLDYKKIEIWKKSWGGRTQLQGQENMPRRTRVSLAKKATVAASPKILQLELWREMFSATYGLNGPIKGI